MADSSKTEKATPKRRRDERKKGNIFFSNDAVSVLVLLSCFAVTYAVGPMAVERLDWFFRYCYQRIQADALLYGLELTELIHEALWTVVIVAGPILAVAIFAGIGVTLFQTKMLITGETLKPKWDRLNPINGMKRLFSLRSIIEALKGILKIVILLYLVYQFIYGLLTSLVRYMQVDFLTACRHLFDQCFSLTMQIMLAYIVLAGADIFYQWWEYERNLRMSKQEIKEEFKQMEGDPKIKGKIKQMQRQMAMSRMMQQVPEADVVIKNPTHFAVALRYRPETDAAPIVLAKGQDHLALKIIAIAEEHKITVIENIPLARALYAQTDLNRQIPPELYNAVAEVLVYLYKLNGTIKS